MRHSHWDEYNMGWKANLLISLMLKLEKEFLLWGALRTKNKNHQGRGDEEVMKEQTIALIHIKKLLLD